MNETESKESKAELMDRLRKERRWDEAQRFKDEVLKACRERGLGRKEANEHAWGETAKAFAPLPAAELPATDEKTSADGTVDATAAVSSEIPWQDLPDEADYEAEVRWAYQQFAFVVKEFPGSRSVLKWEQASRQPPSRGAVAMLRFGATNPAKFLGDIVPKILGGQGDGADDAESMRRERKSIAEIEGVLAQMNQQFAAKMAADAPEAIRGRVRSAVGDWVQRFEIAEVHEICLEGELCRLVAECVKASGASV